MDQEQKVGYGKPPIKHQFKKGKSGNPSGRRKLNLRKPPFDFQKDLMAELKSPVTIIEAGKKKTITAAEALIKSFVAQALKGDKTRQMILMNYLKELPKWAFSDDEVVGVTLKKDVEAFEKTLLEIAAQFPDLPEPGSDPENNNTA
jgi:Family of unknown function (DUF5681)